MAARKTKGTKDIPWPEQVRDRIRASMLEKEMIKHVLGQRDMTQTQARVALGLLDKVLPSLSQNDMNVTGDLTVSIVRFSDVAPRTDSK
jgi:hypothetical protein